MRSFIVIFKHCEFSNDHQVAILLLIGGVVLLIYKHAKEPLDCDQYQDLRSQRFRTLIFRCVGTSTCFKIPHQISNRNVKTQIRFSSVLDPLDQRPLSPFINCIQKSNAEMQLFNKFDHYMSHSGLKNLDSCLDFLRCPENKVEQRILFLNSYHTCFVSSAFGLPRSALEK